MEIVRTDQFFTVIPHPQADALVLASEIAKQLGTNHKVWIYQDTIYSAPLNYAANTAYHLRQVVDFSSENYPLFAGLDADGFFVYGAPTRFRLLPWNNKSLLPDELSILKRYLDNNGKLPNMTQTHNELIISSVYLGKIDTSKNKYIINQFIESGILFKSNTGRLRWSVHVIRWVYQNLKLDVFRYIS